MDKLLGLVSNVIVFALVVNVISLLIFFLMKVCGLV